MPKRSKSIHTVIASCLQLAIAFEAQAETFQERLEELTDDLIAIVGSLVDVVNESCCIDTEVRSDSHIIKKLTNR